MRTENYPAETEVPSLAPRLVCAKSRQQDRRSAKLERAATGDSLTGKVFR
jgi:hypothetical protein